MRTNYILPLIELVEDYYLEFRRGIDQDTPKYTRSDSLYVSLEAFDQLPLEAFLQSVIPDFDCYGTHLITERVWTTFVMRIQRELSFVNEFNFAKGVAPISESVMELVSAIDVWAKDAFQKTGCVLVVGMYQDRLETIRKSTQRFHDR